MAILLLELMELMRTCRIHLDLQWVRRDDNVEADAITNEEFGMFSEQLRVPVDPKKVKWLALSGMFEAGQRLYESINAEREAQRKRGPGGAEVPGRATKRRLMDSLKMADPW